jgi:hypothetical protein
VTQAASEPVLEAALRAACQVGGGTMMAFHVMRIIDHVRGRHDGPFASVFEMGSFGNTGLAALLMSRGVERVGLCNPKPIEPRLSPAQVDNLRFLSNLGGHAWRGDHLRPAGDHFVIDPDRLELFAETAYEDVRLARPYDFLFSASVLEHLDDAALSACMDKMWGDLTPNGWMLHTIDLRDHSAMDDPLRFLRLSEAEYAARYHAGLGHRRRWRAYVEQIEARGFEVRYLGFSGPAKTAAGGGTDMFDRISQPIDGIFLDRPDALPPVETADLAPPYRDMDPADLRVMGVRVVARKR